MAAARFACICDRCGQRSAEYKLWWSCLECAADVCDACIVAGSADDEYNQAVCKQCESAFDVT